MHGVQQAVSLVRVAKAPPGGQRYRFGRSLTRVVIVKEWRLIARDPQLISQVLLQLLYMLPLCFLLLMRGGAQLPGIGASLTFLCGSLTGGAGVGHHFGRGRARPAARGAVQHGDDPARQAGRRGHAGAGHRQPAAAVGAVRAIRLPRC